MDHNDEYICHIRTSRDNKLGDEADEKKENLAKSLSNEDVNKESEKRKSVESNSSWDIIDPSGTQDLNDFITIPSYNIESSDNSISGGIQIFFSHEFLARF